MPTASGETSQRYCVIGAGPSGLAQARAFKALDIEFDVFERHANVGGIWDLNNPGTPMYESAHLISSRDLSGFQDFPMPTEYPDYPSQRQVFAYLESFAKTFGLERHIQFNTPVEHVLPQERGVSVTVGGQQREYAGVVCASGWQWTPSLPELPGTFTGTVRHSRAYRAPTEFQNKRVLIVGLGNSGADIACDAAHYARETYVSIRRGYHFIPKHILGKPADAFAEDSVELPRWLELWFFGILQRLLIGDVSRYGMPKPDHRLLESHPLMNDQLLHHLRHGDVTLKPNLKQLSGTRVTFEDDSSVDVDEILLATGYRMTLPYLDEAYLEKVGDHIAHYLTCFSRSHPNLFTLGQIEFNGALFPQLDRLALLIANYARACIDAPERAERFRQVVKTDTPDLAGGLHMIDSPRHAFYCDSRALRKHTLRVFDELGWTPPSALDLSPEGFN